MGRKTYESIGKPLPDRVNIVLSRDENFASEGCLVAHTLDEAWALAGEGEVFVIGGGQIYAQTIKVADKLYLTVIEKDAPADTRTPARTEMSTIFPFTKHLLRIRKLATQCIL